MNIRVRTSESKRYLEHKAVVEDESLLYFHCADPLELNEIARTGIIPENGTKQADASLRLYPGARDCVDLHDFAGLRKYFKSGVGVVLSLNCLEGQLFRPHLNSAKDCLPGTIMHKGEIDLRGIGRNDDSLVSFYSLSGTLNNTDFKDLELYHPWLYGKDLEEYTILRQGIVERTLGFELPSLEKLSQLEPETTLANYQSACVESISNHFDCINVNHLLSDFYQMLYCV